MNKKRLTILAYPMETSFGGPPRVVDALTPEISKHFDTTVVVFGHSDPTFFKNINKDVKIIRQRSLTRSIYRPVLWLKKDIRNALRKSDLILIHGVYFSYLFLISFMVGIQAKKFIMPHGVFEPYQQKISRYRKKIFDEILDVNKFWSNAVFIVATNSEVVGVKLKFPKSEVAVVGLPVVVPFDLIPKNAKQLASENTVNLVHVGRIAEKKRIDLTLNAVAELKKLGIDTKFAVVGKGTDKLEKELKELTKVLNIESQVSFKGQLDGVNLYKEYIEADIMILPSENENFAISVGESLQLKTPCVVSSEVALSEVVKAYKAGEIIKNLTVADLVNAIILMYENYAYYSNNAFNMLDLFSIESVSRNWMQILNREFD